MRPRVAIIYNQPEPSRYGSMGEDRAVSGVLEEAAGVRDALSAGGYPVFRLPLLPPLDLVKAELERLEADVVFNLFEGFAGCPETEAAVASLLAELGWCYTGCPAPALALALDKPKTKELLRLSGIKTPRYQLLSPFNLSAFSLDFPCIVKPSGEDASHGLSEESLVSNLFSLKEQVVRTSELFGGLALVEEFVEGREFNVTMLGNEKPVVLPVSEIAYTLPPGKPRILTFASKWDPDNPYFHSTNAVCPAEIDADFREEIESVSRSAFRLIGCRGYARIDMRLDKDGNLNVLEVNPNPDISPSAGAARQARAAGMTYNHFIERIVLLALEGRQ